MNRRDNNPDYLPLVSCLCVTHNNPLMLERVIKCFNNQTYKNKQLIIVYEDSDMTTCEFVDNMVISDILKIVKVHSGFVKNTLGTLRNLSVNAADGEYICQWDDDDWYSPDRIEVQVNHILSNNRIACVLSRWIVFDSCNNKAYISNKRTWEGSILCKKEVIQENPYADLPMGEDTCVINYLLEQNALTTIDNMPQLYIYIYHKGNTWGIDHFKEIFSASIELPDNIAEEISCLIE